MGKNITVGAGDVFIQKYTNEIPDDATLESEANKVGHTKGGVTFSYSVTKNPIVDDKGVIVDNAIQEETVTCKFGMLSYDAEDIAKVCSTGKVTKTGDKITVDIGGADNVNSDKWLIRFVHTNKNGVKTRHTLLGTVEEGFSLPYTLGDASIIDCTFTGQKIDETGTLLRTEQNIVSE